MTILNRLVVNLAVGFVAANSLSREMALLGVCCG
jgi:hypothetical protein